MPKIETRINPENGKTEYFINYPVKNWQSLEKLINTINNSRKDKTTTIFITQPITLKEDTTINFDISINNCVFENEITIQNCTFNGEFNFINNIFDNVEFSNSTFKYKCHFMGSKFHGTTRFSCNFNDNVIFGLSTEDDKKKTEFFGETCFAGTTFEKKVRFLSCIFHQHTSFNNTTFNDLVDFYGATFKFPQQFRKTDFNSVAVFNYTVFEKEAQFIYCSNKPSSYINFQNSIFKKGLDISRSNFTCSMAFWGIQIDDNGILKAFSSQLYKEDFNTKDSENNNDSKDSIKTAQKLRESIRYIKNNFLSENNKIEALNFYKKEMEIYRKEISISKNKKSKTQYIDKIGAYLLFGFYFAFCSILLIYYCLNYENKKLYWTFIFFACDTFCTIFHYQI